MYQKKTKEFIDLYIRNSINNSEAHKNVAKLGTINYIECELILASFNNISLSKSDFRWIELTTNPQWLIKTITESNWVLFSQSQSNFLLY